MNPVELLKNEYDTIGSYLQDTQQVSLFSDLNKHSKKVLLLAAGSYFEYQITCILKEFVYEKSNHDQRIVSFLDKQAIDKRYFTLFSWGEADSPDKPVKSAKTFWKLFGNDFYEAINRDIAINTDICNATEAFIEIGHLRNILVHSNFADYKYDDKTTDEIYGLFCRAEKFVEYVKEKLC